MRISDPNSSANLPPVQPTATHPATDPAATGTIQVGSDHAELSSVADRLSEILQSDTGTRAERLQQLKEAVAAGTYHVDTAAVSRALIDEALSAGDGKK